MLYRTANVLGYDTASYATDHSGVANWAIEGVDFVTTKGVMNGTGDGFDPEGKYTKEQAILTMVRFIERVN
ncbi:MAG TPA: S-layer homology domain-containing protein [Candidatus Aphodoplasma excrementigallinarum]|uniref:S-layer homology domain-containing protein n=1 Tax=Candidatus Aphodoplasma excrementigallinarum TaxID=2840673 RepID=A0A9D1NHQ2_9FIRM|nr:S-layer homology domain-containing protein [Candidatus Aphodoplasma excrementigallinarum]